MKYTKGEWKAMYSDMLSVHWIQADKRNIIILNGGADDATPIEETKANAKLIAAAPDLLNALQGLIDDIKSKPNDTRYSNHLQIAYAAIKKATE